ncbi:MAG: hypothetical protein AB7L90_17255 [Hyphomicrobiaceae bacterium]
MRPAKSIYKTLPSVIAILFSVALLWAKNATAAELIVYGAEHCQVSRHFEKEVTTDFAASPASRVFPLRVVDIANGPAGVALIEPITSTPTFVFVDKGAEIARFVGYPGKEHFLRLVEGAADAFVTSNAGLR